ncbi:DUF4214 domain-containing protein [Undibacterium sp. TC9W]|uniref:DUF4214 domain-containing protein n=1 Tax=Undibacterium sp. TC9W TaxID=3413053 RepID=UPI003BF415EF
MAYIIGNESHTDEKTYGYDSSEPNTTFKVKLSKKSFGKLSSSDLVDWYALELDGPADYILNLSTDSVNSLGRPWAKSNSGVKIEITDRNGNPVSGASSAVNTEIFETTINFHYTGQANYTDYFVKVTNQGNPEADYMLFLNKFGKTTDIMGPTLQSIEIPDTLDLSKNDGQLKITTYAKDDISGIRSFAIVLDAPITYDLKNNGGTSNTLTLTGANDSWKDGASTQTFSIDRTSKNGTYNVVRVDITDYDGNVTSYNSLLLQALFRVNTKIKVYGAIDDVPPTVVSFSPTQLGKPMPIRDELVVTFNEAVVLGYGIITIKDETGKVVASFDAINNRNMSIMDQNKLVIPYMVTLAYDAKYTLSIPKGAIWDLNANFYAGSSDFTFWTIPNPSAVGKNVNGTEGNDYLTGSSLNDVFLAGSGNDIIIAGGGDDIITGGNGLDTLVYTGKMANYTISGNATSLVVKDNFGKDGTDTAGQVERLQFADVTVAFDVNGVAGQAYRIYQAAFGRKPDLAGLGYWIKDMDKGSSLTTVAAGFFQSAEFKQLYGSNPSISTLINNFYQNVLHRAPDQAGFDYWSNQLNKEMISPAGALASFCESAENQAQVIGQIQNGVVYTEWLG